MIVRLRSISVLILVLTGLPALAQPVRPPLDLVVEVSDPGANDWQSEALLRESFQLRYRGLDGTWCVLWALARVDVDSGDPLALDVANLYPGLNLPVGSSPELTTFPDALILQLLYFGTVGSSETAVRSSYQAILDIDETPHNEEPVLFRAEYPLWETAPLSQLLPSVPYGTANEIYSDWVRDPLGDPTVLHSGNILSWAVTTQLGTQLGLTCLGSDIFRQAVDLGLIHVDMYAIALRSFDPGFEPTADPVTMPGLLLLPSVPAPIGVGVSNNPWIYIGPNAPLMQGADRVDPTQSVYSPIKGINTIAALNAFGPMSVEIFLPGASTPYLILRAKPAGPGRLTYVIPNHAVLPLGPSYLRLTTAWGSHGYDPVTHQAPAEAYAFIAPVLAFP